MTAAKTTRDTKFKKGMKGGPGRGHKKPKIELGADMAADMRLAYTTAEKPEDPPGVKQARNLLHKDYERFMTLYARVAPPLGKMEPVASDASSRVLPPAVGPKEERAGEMIEAMLDEFGVKFRGVLEAWEGKDGEAEEGPAGESGDAGRVEQGGGG